jgi:hypothetical protein
MLLLDFFLLVIIGVCIVYSWMLNRRIQSLQDSRVEFARMLKELNISIVKADTSITDLRELSVSTASELKSITEDAKKTSSELMMMSDIGNNITKDLTEKITTIKSRNSDIDVDASINEEKDSNVNKKSALYFDDEDLIDHDAIDKINHINQFKKDIPTIVTESTEDKVSLNQLNYYNTLRRISEKK